MTETIHTLTDSQLRAIINQAAEAAATRALERIGLHDEDAMYDVRELRGILDAWRAAKTAVWSTVVKAATVAMMGALAAGAALQWLERR